jgi:hypothetical protein
LPGILASLKKPYELCRATEIEDQAGPHAAPTAQHNPAVGITSQKGP